MLNLLLSGDTTGTTNSTSIWVYVVLIVLVVAMLVLPSITNRRRMKEYNQMLDQLRVGDEVRTIGGVVGKVTKINTKGELKTFVLETGAKGSKTTMEFDMAAVGTVLKSTYVAPASEKTESKKTNKKEETVETTETVEVEEVNNAQTKETVEAKKEVKAEEKPVEKKTAKKTTKKTTKK